MPFTEFCCRSGGSNLNAGTRKGDSTEPGTSADFIYTGGGFNASTRVFVWTANIDASIAVGDFVSIYDSALSPTVAGYIGRITAVTSNSLTVSATVFAGVKPAATIFSTAVCRVGGAWKGPNAAEQFPFNFFQTLTNVAGNPARINFKNDANYSITATLAHTLIGGPTIWQGYTTSYADGGKAIIDGGTTGASYNLVAPVGAGGAYHTYIDFIFQNNGATGNAEGGVFADFRTKVWRCVVRNVRGAGFAVAQALECEAYACNQSNSGTLGGFTAVAGSDRYTRCISHDNVGSNNCGFYSQSGASYYYDCIADSNGSHGFFFNNEANSVVLHNCDVYNNGGDGFNTISGGQDTLIENCNFVKNAGIGINIASGAPFGQLINNGFGSGTQANVGGDKVGTGILIEIGSVIYPANVTPWVDPANGDFRINLAQAKGAGRGSFTQVAAGYGGAVGYPDIGAVQALGGSGGGLVAFDGMPLVPVGMVAMQGSVALGNASFSQLDAVNESLMMIGQIFTEDGATHTIDTTGSSSLGWRSHFVTFANAATTIKIGLAAVDTTNSVTPGRAVNVGNVITFDVSRTMIGGSGGLFNNAWHEHVPTAGSKTIANGDTVAFAIQMTARGGTDSVMASGMAINLSEAFPVWSEFTGGAYANSWMLPNAVITFSDGKMGFFYGSVVFETPNTLAYYDSASSPKEYGNLLQMPFPAKIYGMVVGIGFDIGSSADFILYSNPLVTPVAERTYSLRGQTVADTSYGGYLSVMFPTPYIAAANQPLAAIVKSTTSVDLGIVYNTFANVNHQKSLTCGMNGYAVNRTTGAFVAQNSGKDRFNVGLLVGAFSAGGGPAKLVNRIGT